MSRLLPAVAIAALLASSAAFAQTTTPNDTDTTPATPVVPAPSQVTPTPPEKIAPAENATSPTMTEAEARAWIDKEIYTSDDKNVGEVAAIMRDAAGRVTGMHADIGGFLGIGSTRVKMMPTQFRLSGDRVIVNLTAEQVKQLPKVTD